MSKEEYVEGEGGGTGVGTEAEAAAAAAAAESELQCGRFLICGCAERVFAAVGEIGYFCPVLSGGDFVRGGVSGSSSSSCFVLGCCCCCCCCCCCRAC